MATDLAALKADYVRDKSRVLEVLAWLHGAGWTHGGGILIERQRLTVGANVLARGYLRRIRCAASPTRWLLQGCSYGSAATTDSSTNISGSHNFDSTVARVGAVPFGSHLSHTLFIPAKSASMSFR